MGDSRGSVSIDMETISLGGMEHVIHTGRGPVSVAVFGDQDKPALVTYPDVALNHMSCFQGLFFCPEAASLLLHNFCIYHITPPGHELGAAAISSDIPVPSVDDLADQIAEVLDFFGLDAVMCLGVTAGAYILTLFAMKYRERVFGLILVSPLCQAPSWTEWLYNKVISNFIYFYGICGMSKEWLLQRYFSKEVRGCANVAESDIVQACRRFLDERQSSNVLRFLEAISRRRNLTEGLRKLQCRTLIFVGDDSPFHSEALHMATHLDRRYSALVEDTLMGALHSQGKTVEETSDCLKRIPLHPSVVSAIKTAYSLGCDLRIVSDANHFFIETILKNHGLIEYFSEINTNPVVINEEGRLRINPYHDFHTSPPHGCNLCPPNMCKGSIIERIRASIKKTIIYLGDGSGDFCPSLKLEECDRVMPRKNFPLWELICKSPTLVRAEVHEWSNAQELGDVLLQLIRGLVSVENNSSSSNLISDCKSQIPSYPHEAIAKALPVPL